MTEANFWRKILFFLHSELIQVHVVNMTCRVSFKILYRVCKVPVFIYLVF